MYVNVGVYRCVYCTVDVGVGGGRGLIRYNILTHDLSIVAK